MNEADVPSTLQQYGPLGVIAAIFATVIVYLFRLLMSRSDRDEARVKATAEERAGWTAERDRLRAEYDEKNGELRLEYEEKHRELVEKYAAEVTSDRNANRAHEDLVRREFSDLMEKLSEDNVKSSEEMVQMLQKFHDRFVGPSSRRK